VLIVASVVGSEGESVEGVVLVEALLGTGSLPKGSSSSLPNHCAVVFSDGVVSGVVVVSWPGV